MIRNSYIFRVLFLVLAIASSQALVSEAAVVTVPAGLIPGDQYRLIFLTSGTRDAESSNIADYNTFVTNAALAVPELAALGTTWSVIGSTAVIDARDNTGTNPMVSSGVSFYRLDGELVAHDNNDLWDGSPTAAIDFTELGDSWPGRTVWTGTDTDGTAGIRPLGDDEPVAGGSIISEAVPYQWIQYYSPPGASEPLHFYAVSGVLTVVPEPGTVVMGGIGLLMLIGWSMRRRKAA